jgi:hypothetical protein
LQDLGIIPARHDPRPPWSATGARHRRAAQANSHRCS